MYSEGESAIKTWKKGQKTIKSAAQIIQGDSRKDCCDPDGVIMGEDPNLFMTGEETPDRLGESRRDSSARD